MNNGVERSPELLNYFFYFLFMSSLNPHSPSQKSKGGVIFPMKSELLDEIKNGQTEQFKSNIRDLKSDLRFQSRMSSIDNLLDEIKKNPVPPNVDFGEWEVLSRFSRNFKPKCPISNYMMVCSRRASELRIVYELYGFGSELKVLFTNCDYHVYRNKLYSVSQGEDTEYVNYRGVIINL